jgi:hypothetical protein
VQQWYQDGIVGPARLLRDALAVGDVADSDRHPAADTIEMAIEALFRGEAKAQYAGWPREMTTDGSVAHLVVRPAEDTVVVAGSTCADFGPDAFPHRAEVVLDQQGSATFTLQVGEVDARTGAPPRLTGPILVAGTIDGQVTLELILGRRQIPITWTTVVELGPAKFEG